jgi:hypothetical protein
MTALSRRHAPEICNFSNLTPLARLSLVTWGVMALGNAGCLITDTPAFDAPRRTAPYLTNLDPSPMHTQSINLVPGTTATYETEDISFDLESEDLGQRVTVLLYVDLKGLYSPINPLPIKTWDLAPGTLKSPRRTTTYTMDLNNPAQVAGCHAITVVASHDFFTVPPRPVDVNDVDTATWFYYVGVNPSEPEYEPCKPVPPPADAGADARDGGGL